MNKRPIIALSASIDGEKRICVKQEYISALQQAGAVPTPFAYETDKEKLFKLCQDVDGVLICGGSDLHPARYGEDIDGSVDICEERDAFELLLIECAIRAGKPILGICRGAQILNVYFNGSLNQHIEGHANEFVDDRTHHGLSLTENSIYKGLVDESTIYVNSYHHQSVKRLGDGLEVDAVCGDCIEAFHHKDFEHVVGAQWHPERRPGDEINSVIFKHFIQAASK